MKSVKYFIQFLIISTLFLFFKILGLRYASYISGKIVSFIGPFFRSKNLIESNILKALPNLRSNEIMEKNMDLIKETRRLNNEIEKKDQELKIKIKLDSKYNKKLVESKYNYKKLEIKKIDLLKKIRILRLKKINERVKKLRLSGKLPY